MAVVEMQLNCRTELYQGPAGYVSVTKQQYAGQQGVLLYYANPDPRKLHAVDTRGMQEWEAGLAAIESAAVDLQFAVFYGAYDPVHAGADITEFAGEPDYPAIRTHLLRGAALDARVKALWPRMRTVGVICGDRYGGSLEWPLFAEHVVADSRSTMQFSEIHLGIIPGWNGVLNALLKCGQLNAKYMGQTGNQLKAAQALQIGLVNQLVETPSPPDRKATGPEEWPSVWAAHAGVCQALLLEAALNLATSEPAAGDESYAELVTPLELEAEVARRTAPEAYRQLRDEIANRAMAVPPEDQDSLKQIGREVAARLIELGKPLAPLGVRAVGDYVDKWSPLPREELLARFAEAGAEESNLCADLMETPHRVVGVNAVLSKAPVEKVTIFD